MNIGIDASRANKEAMTGTEWYSYNMILQLAKIDQKNRYILYTPDKLGRKLANLPNNFEEKILKWPPKKLWTMIRLSWEMQLHAPDILFVPAHIIPLVSPRKTVTTIMDVGFLRRPSVYPQKELKYHNFGLKQAIKKASKILTISNFSKKEMVELCGIDPDRIKVIHLGFDPGIFRKIENREEINNVLIKYKIPTDKPYFFYVGRLEEKKNTPGLVRAFAKFKKAHKGFGHKLVLAGSRGHNYEEIARVIKESGLEGEVIETGWMHEKDLPYLYNGALALVFPSFYEGFGLPLLEAMSCGTPIVASNVASIPEVASDAALLFDPDDIGDMARKLGKIVENKNVRDRLIESGKRRVQDFSWERCARETLKEILL